MPDPDQVSLFFLVLLRAVAFLTAGPLFSLRGIPPAFKVGFSMALAIIIFPSVTADPASLPEGLWGYGVAVASETLTGLLLGTIVTIILNSIKLAGQIIDLQIGYAMANIMDPANTAQSTLLSNFLHMLGMMFFLLIDGHHTLIMALAESYQLVPLGGASFSGGLVLILAKIFSGSIAVAIQVCAPVLAVLLITDLALGFLARTTPQINVFITGFPLKIAFGLLTLSFLIPFLGTVLRTLLNMAERDLLLIMKALV